MRIKNIQNFIKNKRQINPITAERIRFFTNTKVAKLVYYAPPFIDKLRPFGFLLKGFLFGKEGIL